MKWLLSAACIGLTMTSILMYDGNDNAVTTRYLREDGIKKRQRSNKQKSRTIKRAGTKSGRLNRLVNMLTTESLPNMFRPISESQQHNPTTKYVILSAAIQAANPFDENEYLKFLGTARKVGFDGDVVIAVKIPPKDKIMRIPMSYKAIIYNTYASLNCTGQDHETRCSFYGLPQQYYINFMRFFLYRWWASIYDKDTIILLSDFSDVFFQSNPFTYRAFEWAPPASQLAVFQEAHPNMVINRCIFNGEWIKSCYGEDGLKRIGHNTVICSGVTLGTRDAILAYVS